jgi:hypothetical protein
LGRFYIGVFFLKPLHPSGGVHQFLFAGKKGMALGTDLYSDLLLSRAGGKFRPAGAAGSDLMVGGMNFFFHDRFSP